MNVVTLDRLVSEHDDPKRYKGGKGKGEVVFSHARTRVITLTHFIPHPIYLNQPMQLSPPRIDETPSYWLSIVGVGEGLQEELTLLQIA